jgi:hypothetical protein
MHNAITPDVSVHAQFNYNPEFSLAEKKNEMKECKTIMVFLLYTTSLLLWFSVVYKRKTITKGM